MPFTIAELTEVGRITVTAARLDLSVGMLITLWERDKTAFEFLDHPGRARRDLAKLANGDQELSAIVDAIDSAYGRRNRVTHDLSAYQKLDGGGLVEARIDTSTGQVASAHPRLADLQALTAELQGLIGTCNNVFNRRRNTSTA